MNETLYQTLRYEARPWARAVHESSARYRIADCGRRCGKSYMSSVEAIEALLPDDQRVWVVGPSYRECDIVFEFVVDMMFAHLPMLIAGQPNRNERILRLINGSIFEARSADKPDLLRGPGVNLLILEEAAMLDPYVVGPVLRPTIADTHGSILAISTPRGYNWFFEWFMSGQDPLQPNYNSWQVSSREVLPPEEIEELCRMLTQDEVRQEIDAEFVSAAGMVFTGLDECLRAVPKDPRPGVPYVMAADLGKYMDFTALVVLDAFTQDMVHFQRLPELDWNIQQDYIVQLSQRYNKAPVWVDATGLGDPVCDALMARGVRVEPYKFTLASKNNLVQSLRLAIEQGAIGIIDNPILVGELRGFQYTKTAGGQTTSAAPTGGHDDCVFAAALAWWGLHNGTVLRPPVRPYREMWR